MTRLEEYETLMRRSRMFLEEAREAYQKERYDLAVFLAEQGLQLYLKAQLLRVAGDYPRTHSVRQLLSLLARALGGEAVEVVSEFSRRMRPRLSELEDVYIAARYTTRVYTREDAKDILETVEEVMRLVERLLKGAPRDAPREEEDTPRLGETSA